MVKGAAALIAIVGSALITGACDRPASECASATYLTAAIGGRTYRVPASDQPSVQARNRDDVFWRRPSTREGPGPYLLQCQRTDKVPVEVDNLHISPPTLQPEVAYIHVETSHPEPGRFTPISLATSLPWIPLAASSRGEEQFRLGNSGQVVSPWCSNVDATDVYGRRIPQWCNIYVALTPVGLMRLQYLRPSDPRDGRETLIRAERYLQSLRSGS